MMTPPRDGRGVAPLNNEHAIRLAIPDDLDAVRTIAEAAYAMYVPRIGRKPAPMVADFATQIAAGNIWLSCKGNRISGYMALYPHDDHLHVESIAVGPEFQGQGIGRALLDFVEIHARDNGLGAIELYTNEKMTENLMLYPRLGYREVDRRSEDGFARVYFRKDLI